MGRTKYWLIFFFLTYWSLVTTVCAASNISFNDKDLDKGIIHITYTGTEKLKLKVMISKDDKKYTYDLNLIGTPETFPLQMGNGTYKISVLKNVKGTSYVTLDAKTVKVDLKDEKKLYLTAIQNINWDSDSKPIQKAIELTKDASSIEEKAKILYKNIVHEYTYDYDKLATLPVGYLPNIDLTYDEKTGICYDFSSLFAAMLRSQNIPAKLIKGYTPNAQGYHAWNEVYDEKLEDWVIIDTTYDLQVIKKKPFINWIKPEEDYQKTNQY